MRRIADYNTLNSKISDLITGAQESEELDANQQKQVLFELNFVQIVTNGFKTRHSATLHPRLIRLINTRYGFLTPSKSSSNRESPKWNRH